MPEICYSLLLSVAATVVAVVCLVIKMLELDMQSVSVILTVVNMILAALVAVLGYLFRRTAANERELTQFKLQVADRYAHKADMAELRSHLNDLFLRLEGKIDDVGDKVYQMRGRVSDQS